MRGTYLRVGVLVVAGMALLVGAVFFFSGSQSATRARTRRISATACRGWMSAPR